MEQNSKYKCKERGTDEGASLLIYIIKQYEYRGSLRKLICKLRIFITSKNVGK